MYRLWEVRCWRSCDEWCLTLIAAWRTSVSTTFTACSMTLDHVDIASRLLFSVVYTCETCVMEKSLGERQTLRAGCSKAEPNILPRRRPPSRGAQNGQNLISWRWSLPSPTDPVWWRSMHAISSYHGNRPTKPQTHKQTYRTDYNALRR